MERSTLPFDLIIDSFETISITLTSGSMEVSWYDIWSSKSIAKFEYKRYSLSFSISSLMNLQRKNQYFRLQRFTENWWKEALYHLNDLIIDSFETNLYNSNKWIDGHILIWYIWSSKSIAKFEYKDILFPFQFHRRYLQRKNQYFRLQRFTESWWKETIWTI